MAKKLALGTKLYVESDTPGTYILVGNLTSIGVPGPDKPEVDVTDYDSTAAEFLPGLPDYGELPISGNYNPENAGQTLLFDDAQDLNAPVRGWRIDFTNQDERFSFQGFVKSFKPSAGGHNEPYKFEGTIRVTGSVTRAAIP